MDYVVAAVYDNYVAAHITRGRMEEEGISCWLKDENTVTIDPILTHAVGGIKLMVAAADAEKAAGILRVIASTEKQMHPCSNCGSLNVEYISSPRKPANWFSALMALLLTSFAPKLDMVYHCFDCGHEYPLEEGDFTKSG